MKRYLDIVEAADELKTNHDWGCVLVGANPTVPNHIREEYPQGQLVETDGGYYWFWNQDLSTL